MPPKDIDKDAWGKLGFRIIEVDRVRDIAGIFRGVVSGPEQQVLGKVAREQAREEYLRSAIDSSTVTE